MAASAQTIKGKALSQRFYIDLNPTVEQHWTFQLWFAGLDPVEKTAIDSSQYGAVVVNPEDNAANLSEEYLADLRSLPPAQRKRFYEGRYGSDDADALWRREVIQRTDEAPDLARIVADEIGRRIVYHRYPFTDVVEAFRIAADKGSGSVKVHLQNP